MSMTIADYVHRTAGQDALLNAKIQEFRALVQVGADTTGSRDDAHTLLDAMLDGMEDAIKAVMRGDFA